jgi:hypothetical protein
MPPGTDMLDGALGDGCLAEWLRGFQAEKHQREDFIHEKPLA